MSAKNLISGFIVGAAVGAAAGLLLAPASGRQMRRRLMKGSIRMKRDVVDNVGNSIDALRGEINERISKVMGRSRDANHAVEELASKARNQ